MKVNPRYLALKQKYSNADCEYKKALTHWVDNPTPKNEKAKDSVESRMNAIWKILQNVPGWIEDEQ